MITKEDKPKGAQKAADSVNTCRKAAEHGEEEIDAEEQGSARSTTGLHYFVKPGPRTKDSMLRNPGLAAMEESNGTEITMMPIAAVPEVHPTEKPPAFCRKEESTNDERRTHLVQTFTSEEPPDSNNLPHAHQEDAGALPRVGAFHVPGPGMMAGDEADQSMVEQPNAESFSRRDVDGDATVFSAHVVEGRNSNQRLRKHLQRMAANAALVEGKAVPTRTGKFGQHKAFLIAIAIVIAAVIGILAGFFLHRNGQDGDKELESSLPSLVPTILGVSLRSARISNITKSISNPSSFLSPSSPQRMARDWLLYNDTFTFSPPSKRSDAEIGQRYILAVLYYALGGEGWANSKGFLSGASVCNRWYGIKCNKHAHMPNMGAVSHIELKENDLSGTLPEELTHLSMLEVLDLNGGYVKWIDDLGYDRYRSLGKINGTIPSTIGALTWLKELTLAFNELSGTLPTRIWSLTNLTELRLENNRLSGTISSAIGNLRRLKTLSLWRDADIMSYGEGLTGTIPLSIWTLKSLKWLSLAQNNLSGSIPSNVGNLKNLKLLNLGWNRLSGSLPSTVGKLFSLRTLDLVRNGFTGIIPATLLNRGQLEVLNFAANRLSGTISSRIGSLVNLVELVGDRNKLNGTIPASIGNLTKLELMDLGSNRLKGAIPSSIGNLIKLEELDLGSNRLNGAIPSSIGTLTKLKELTLAGNILTGFIPVTLGHLLNLKMLWLNNNKLSGTIPSSLGNLKSLREWRLQTNRLTGTVPSSLGSLFNLTRMHLEDNSLRGTIPDSVCSLREEGRLRVIRVDCLGFPPEIICGCCGACGYPNCTVEFPFIVGDGRCNTGDYNTEACGWDGGDCIDFNEKYPNCSVDRPYYISNGQCQGGQYNTKECGFDGGDWDGPECIAFRERYPDCNVRYPAYVGDGWCHDYDCPSHIPDAKCHGGGYNTAECGWDGGDCDLYNSFPNCNVQYPSSLRNGRCDGGAYNTEACGDDGGDCSTFNEIYPNCTVSNPSWIGNGRCNDGDYNSENCGWDGGDC